MTTTDIDQNDPQGHNYLPQVWDYADIHFAEPFLRTESFYTQCGLKLAGPLWAVGTVSFLTTTTLEFETGKPPAKTTEVTKPTALPASPSPSAPPPPKPTPQSSAPQSQPSQSQAPQSQSRPQQVGPPQNPSQTRGGIVNPPPNSQPTQNPPQQQPPPVQPPAPQPNNPANNNDNDNGALPPISLTPQQSSALQNNIPVPIIPPSANPTTIPDISFIPTTVSQITTSTAPDGRIEILTTFVPTSIPVGPSGVPVITLANNNNAPLASVLAQNGNANGEELASLVPTTIERAVESTGADGRVQIITSMMRTIVAVGANGTPLVPIWVTSAVPVSFVPTVIQSVVSTTGADGRVSSFTTAIQTTVAVGPGGTPVSGVSFVPTVIQSIITTTGADGRVSSFTKAIQTSIAVGPGGTPVSVQALPSRVVMGLIATAITSVKTRTGKDGRLETFTTSFTTLTWVTITDATRTATGSDHVPSALFSDRRSSSVRIGVATGRPEQTRSGNAASASSTAAANDVIAEIGWIGGMAACIAGILVM